MNRSKLLLIIGFAALLLASFSLPAEAQLGGLKRRVKKKVEDKAAEKTGEAIDKAAEGEQEEKTDSAKAEEQSGGKGGSEKQSEGSAGTESAQKPGEGVWVKYDFVPGDRVIFFDDFTRDEVGNFPQRLELTKGNMEVAEWKGTRWLRTPTYSDFSIPLPEVLPDGFTLEFDYYAPAVWPQVEVTCLMPEDNRGITYDEVFFSTFSGGAAGIRNADSDEEIAVTRLTDDVIEGVMHCQVMADKKYMKVYVNGTRVSNFPNTNFGRSNKIRFYTSAAVENPAMFANFRVAASGKKIYDALMADGRVATQGILFDSGSDRIRPESTPTLKEIGQMLKDHADLKLMIEGHTDNVGDDASNQTLSDKRANAVRGYLISQFGIDSERLQAKGFGESKPVSSNDSAEGRQNNRRVELVKI
jgi:outer membrane protein OmpA-like peptidoglycan-associated protein/Sec-independent protein translocase protein TatA